jgi:hypothetical protein
VGDRGDARELGGPHIRCETVLSCYDAETARPADDPAQLGALVKPPLDSYATGAQLLERLRGEVRDVFPERMVALSPFLTRAERCFEQLRARTQSGEPDGPELVELRQQLMAAFSDLEDICEAFLGLGR